MIDRGLRACEAVFHTMAPSTNEPFETQAEDGFEACIAQTLLLNSDFLSEPCRQVPGSWQRNFRFPKHPGVEVTVVPTMCDYDDTPQLQFSIAGMLPAKVMVTIAGYSRQVVHSFRLTFDHCAI
jgi:hypothetical protein